jgi:hypothetical protein
MHFSLFGYDFEVKKRHDLSVNTRERSDVIKTELLSRIHSFFGSDGLARIENSFVIVSLFFLRSLYV